MKRQLSALVGAAVYLVSLSEVAAQASYSAPWDAASDAAAERAIARLGQKRWLEIRASVRTIPMPTARIESAPDSKSLIDGSTASGLPQDPKLLPNTPKDRPVDARGTTEIDEYRAAIAAYVAKGRQTYPEAKKRYLAGLPPGRTFFVVTNLHDKAGTTEQVFVAVASVRGGQITGRIATGNLTAIRYKKGDSYSFPESDLIDWLITHPDGTEEGNVVGKFIDEWGKTRRRQ
jgi:hypothetical protein